MANKNILMQKKNGASWDVLYPITMATNVFDANGKSVDDKLKNIITQSTIVDSSNIFTLDLALNRNFTIDITNVTGKTISFTNIPELTFVEPIQVKVICTAGNTITFPTGTVWLCNIIPDFIIGKTYYITFIRTTTGWHTTAMGGY